MQMNVYWQQLLAESDQYQIFLDPEKLPDLYEDRKDEHGLLILWEKLNHLKEEIYQYLVNNFC
jgi:hypothetical protein